MKGVHSGPTRNPKTGVLPVYNETLTIEEEAELFDELELDTPFALLRPWTRPDTLTDELIALTIQTLGLEV